MRTALIIATLLISTVVMIGCSGDGGNEVGKPTTSEPPKTFVDPKNEERGGQTSAPVSSQ